MARGGRRHKGGRKRRGDRKQLPAFHIFCEGKNTEPLYFNAFGISNMKLCKGDGETKLKLVETAAKYKRSNGINANSIDQVWVVFDYDFDPTKQPKQKQDFNNAINKAEDKKIKWAVSNDAFELWFVLHFLNCNSQQHRSWYNNKLSTHLNISYNKDRRLARQMYNVLLQNQESAIERAENLEAKYDENDRAYADKNPYTTVHKLVKELNKYKK